jgi:hypothetical protein
MQWEENQKYDIINEGGENISVRINSREKYL